VRWPYRDELIVYSDLRNVLVHERIKPFSYIANPSTETVESIEKISDYLLDPPRVIPRFQKTVELVDFEDSVSSILSKINRLGYSQFPVYEKERLRGLLTENGITRWLSKHTTEQLTLVDFDEVSVTDLFAEEEKRRIGNLVHEPQRWKRLLIGFRPTRSWKRF